MHGSRNNCTFVWACTTPPLVPDLQLELFRTNMAVHFIYLYFSCLSGMNALHLFADGTRFEYEHCNRYDSLFFFSVVVQCILVL